MVNSTPNQEQILLMLDEQSVDQASNLEFRLNQARKCPVNPVLSPGYPHEFDSLQISWPATVLYDANERKFRCWYSSLDAVQASRPPSAWENAYAESDDGIHWIKPDLGQYEHLGSPTNKLVFDWKPLLMSLVMENPRPADPEERFFALFNSHSAKFSKDFAISADGKTWHKKYTIYEAGSAARASFQDVSQLLFDPDEKDPDLRVKGYTQVLEPCSPDARDVRCIGLVHGKDFASLCDYPGRVVLAPEPGIDEELHFAAVKKIGRNYLMLFESDQFSTRHPHGDLRLAVSNDGIHFRRVHSRVPLVPTGNRGMWDEGMLVTTTSCIQEVGDEIWIFYLGVPSIYTCWPPQYALSGNYRGSFYYPSYLGVAVLAKDRYAYIQAVNSGWGECLTYPISFGRQKKLYFNADFVNSGDLIADLEPTDGSESVTGAPGSVLKDGVYREIVWNRQPETASARLRIKLKGQARLYSFKIC